MIRPIKPRIINLFLFIVISIWLLLIYFDFLSIWFPILSIFKPLLHHMFSLVCHQNSSKLFTCCNHSTFVCFRCLGLYWGAFGSSFLLFFTPYLLLRINKFYFFIALLLVFIDVSSVNLNFYNYNFYLAFLTGFLLGFVSFLYLYKAIFEELTKDNKTND